MYLQDKIDESTFCNDFIPSYDQELDYETLSAEEHQAFSELGKIASRFSEIEEDIMKYPGVYYTKEQLDKKIKETKEKLNKYFETLQDNSSDEMKS